MHEFSNNKGWKTGGLDFEICFPSFAIATDLKAMQWGTVGGMVPIHIPQVWYGTGKEKKIYRLQLWSFERV